MRHKHIQVAIDHRLLATGISETIMRTNPPKDGASWHHGDLSKSFVKPPEHNSKYCTTGSNKGSLNGEPPKGASRTICEDSFAFGCVPVCNIVLAVLSKGLKGRQ